LGSGEDKAGIDVGVRVGTYFLLYFPPNMGMIVTIGLMTGRIDTAERIERLYEL
jgi:hypothetical protein